MVEWLVNCLFLQLLVRRLEEIRPNLERKEWVEHAARHDKVVEQTQRCAQPLHKLRSLALAGLAAGSTFRAASTRR